jgi:hypothetical protein
MLMIKAAPSAYMKFPSIVLICYNYYIYIRVL